jgi:hypothetical protein
LTSNDKFKLAMDVFATSENASTSARQQTLFGLNRLAALLQRTASTEPALSVLLLG